MKKLLLVMLLSVSGYSFYSTYFEIKSIFGEISAAECIDQLIEESISSMDLVQEDDSNDFDSILPVFNKLVTINSTVIKQNSTTQYSFLNNFKPPRI
jgi:hypothetical protein